MEAFEGVIEEGSGVTLGTSNCGEWNGGEQDERPEVVRKLQ